MMNVASRKRWTILLTLSLFFSIFLGSYHHCCDCYSQTCLTCSQTGHHPALLTTANAADNLHPFPANSTTLLPAEIFPTPFTSYTPLKGRAPPRRS
jgi:hypothetical protein